MLKQLCFTSIQCCLIGEIIDVLCKKNWRFLKIIKFKMQSESNINNNSTYFQGCLLPNVYCITFFHEIFQIHLNKKLYLVDLH